MFRRMKQFTSAGKTNRDREEYQWWWQYSAVPSLSVLNTDYCYIFFRFVFLHHLQFLMYTKQIWTTCVTRKCSSAAYAACIGAKLYCVCMCYVNCVVSSLNCWFCVSSHKHQRMCLRKNGCASFFFLLMFSLIALFIWSPGRSFVSFILSLD